MATEAKYFFEKLYNWVRNQNAERIIGWLVAAANWFSIMAVLRSLLCCVSML